MEDFLYTCEADNRYETQLKIKSILIVYFMARKIKTGQNTDKIRKEYDELTKQILQYQEKHPEYLDIRNTVANAIIKQPTMLNNDLLGWLGKCSRVNLSNAYDPRFIARVHWNDDIPQPKSTIPQGKQLSPQCTVDKSDIALPLMPRKSPTKMPRPLKHAQSSPAMFHYTLPNYYKKKVVDPRANLRKKSIRQLLK